MRVNTQEYKKAEAKKNKMDKNELYGYRHQIVRAYWNKGLTEEELSEIMGLPR